MAIDFVQGNSTTGAGVSSVDVAFPSANAAGNTIIVCAGAWNGSSVGTLSVTDSQGNSYTQIQTDSSTHSGDSAVSVWYAKNIAAGANTVTVTAGSGDDIDLIIAEYSGLSSSAPLTASAIAVAAAGTVSTSAVTPSTRNDALLLYSYDQSHAGDSFTFSSSPTQTFTQRQSTSNTGGGESSALSDSIGTFTEATTPTVVCSEGSNALYLVAILLTDGTGGGFGGDTPGDLELLGAWTVQSTTQTVQNGFGTAPLTYALTGTLPTGLSFDSSTGLISGIATEAGTFNVTITATDASGKTAQVALALSLASSALPVDTSVCASILYGWGA